MDEMRTRRGTMADHDPKDVPDATTTDQLRAEIDAGMTGDKSAHTDPSLSPLGTDDEAGGHRNTPEQINEARRQEIRRGDGSTPHEND